MSHTLATIVLAAAGAVTVIAGLLFFRHPGWLLTWLKGTVVFGVILAGLYVLVIAVNLTSYQSLVGMQTVATISTQRQAEQIWEADRCQDYSVYRPVPMAGYCSRLSAGTIERALHVS